MFSVTTYRVKPYLTQEETAEMMSVFAEVGDAPGLVAHYVNADGGGGIVVTDSDDPGKSYDHMLSFTRWMQFETRPMLRVEEAVPHILSRLA